MAKARQVDGIPEDIDLVDCVSHHHYQESPTANRVQVCQSPYNDAFYSHHPVYLTIDSGATGNMIPASSAISMEATITRSYQSAHQADGSSPLKVVGEIPLVFTRDDHELYFVGLVVENLDTTILADILFMRAMMCIITGGVYIFV